MIDIVTVGAGGGSVAWLSPEGALKVGPRSAGADPGPICYGRGGIEPTVTDAHLVLGRIPPHLLGGEVPLDPAAAAEDRAGQRWPGKLGLGPGRAAPPASSRSRPGTRPTRCGRSPSSVDSTSATSRWPRSAAPGRCCCAGSSTSSACRSAWCRATPGTCRRSGCSPSTSRSTTCGPTSPGTTARPGRRRRCARRCCGSRRRQALAAEGFAEPSRAFRRSADLRYFGQAFEVRVPVPDGTVRRPRRRTPAVAAFHDAHEALYGYCLRDDRTSRSSGSTCGSPASGRSAGPALNP